MSVCVHVNFYLVQELFEINIADYSQYSPLRISSFFCLDYAPLIDLNHLKRNYRLRACTIDQPYLAWHVIKPPVLGTLGLHM